MEIINSVIPLVFLILLGIILKKYFINEESFWTTSSKLVYWVLFPALMIESISSADIKTIDNPNFIFVPISIVLFLMALIALTKRIFFKNDAFFVSFIQGAVRYNSYVFIGVTTLYIGNSIMPIIALITTIMVSLTNIVSVFLLSFYSGKTNTLSDTVLNLFKNPLILSCLLGLILSLNGFQFTGYLYNFLHMLGDAALPLSLLSVGADLHFKADYRLISGILFSTFFKLIILPIFVYYGLIMFNFSKEIIIVTVIYAGSPCSTNAYIMSKNMGGDAKSMSLIISMQTILSLPLLAIWLIILEKTL